MFADTTAGHSPDTQRNPSVRAVPDHNNWKVTVDLFAAWPMIVDHLRTCTFDVPISDGDDVVLLVEPRRSARTGADRWRADAGRLTHPADHIRHELTWSQLVDAVNAALDRLPSADLLTFRAAARARTRFGVGPDDLDPGAEQTLRWVAAHMQQQVLPAGLRLAWWDDTDEPFTPALWTVVQVAAMFGDAAERIAQHCETSSEVMVWHHAFESGALDQQQVLDDWDHARVVAWSVR